MVIRSDKLKKDRKQFSTKQEKKQKGDTRTLQKEKTTDWATGAQWRQSGLNLGYAKGEPVSMFYSNDLLNIHVTKPETKTTYL